MVNKLSNKKSVLIAIILALCLSMATAVSFATRARADETLADEKPTANVVLDMDGTSATLEAEGGVNDKNVDNAIPGLFAGAKGETKMVFTNNPIAVGGTVTVKFGKSYKAEYFSTVNIKLAVGAAGEKVLNGYASTDTAFENSAGTVTSTLENENVILSLDASKLSGKDGYISGFVIKKTDGVSGQDRKSVV